MNKAVQKAHPTEEMIRNLIQIEVIQSKFISFPYLFKFLSMTYSFIVEKSEEIYQ